MTELNSKKTLHKTNDCKITRAICGTKNILKNIFSSRIFIAIIFLTIGVAITNSCQKKSYHHSHNFYHSFFEDDEDFFTEFDEMHYRMQKAMHNHRKAMEREFMRDLEENKSNLTTASLRQLEDEKFYNYELVFSGLKPQDINVLFENGYLIFSSNQAEIVNNQKPQENYQSSNSSSFYYATNLPDYDNKIAPEIVKTNEKILVKFTKKIANNTNKKPKKEKS